jgi:hypothetical protein
MQQNLRRGHVDFDSEVATEAIIRFKLAVCISIHKSLLFKLIHK